MPLNIVILDAQTANPGDLSWEPITALGNTKIYASTRQDELVERAKNAHIVLTNNV